MTVAKIDASKRSYIVIQIVRVILMTLIIINYDHSDHSDCGDCGILILSLHLPINFVIVLT